ncbi:MAG: Hpt domain-containing protein [Treponema sp.]|jgi:HPt (histidine-containing phosphotransfer) domain-containing protein|nr:Hpt domain-containing protein [Treponema sp.]
MADDVVYVNIEEGVKRVMNNKKLYVKLLHKFIVDMNIDELFVTVQGGDYEKAQEQAHTIKGAAANLGLTKLSRQIQDFETHIKAKDIKPGIPEAVKVCYDSTIDEIKKVIAQYGS